MEMSRLNLSCHSCSRKEGIVPWSSIAFSLLGVRASSDSTTRQEIRHSFTMISYTSFLCMGGGSLVSSLAFSSRKSDFPYKMLIQSPSPPERTDLWVNITFSSPVIHRHFFSTLLRKFMADPIFLPYLGCPRIARPDSGLIRFIF